MFFIEVGKLIVLFMILLHIIINDVSLKRNMIFNNRILIIVFLILVSIFWGMRPISVGADTVSYLDFYNTATLYDSLSDYLFRYKSDYVFFSLIYFFSRYLTYPFFLIFISVITSIGFYLVYLNISSSIHNNVLRSYYSSIVIFLFFSLFSYTSIYSNIIRNGMALPFSILAVLNLFNRKWVKYVVFTVFSLLIHSSSIIILVFAFILFTTKINVRVCICIYFVSLILSFKGYGLNNLGIVQFLNIEKLSRYAAGAADTSYKIGFRPGFTVYNFFFFVISFLFGNFRNENFNYVFRLYVLLTSFFLFCYNIPYSDRFGLYSWIIIPVMLFYAFINVKTQLIFRVSSLLIIFFFVINYILFV